MSQATTTDLGTAGQRLTAALEASRDDAPEAAACRLFAAELTLRKAGREDLAYQLPDAAQVDVTAGATRQAIREVRGEVAAAVPASVGFTAASDGGGR